MSMATWTLMVWHLNKLEPMVLELCMEELHTLRMKKVLLNTIRKGAALVLMAKVLLLQTA
jgi:hypothetical protein